MVVIGAGLAAMPRDVLEAARTDGANEWQVFRRVTVPLLAPVLSVVFVTMIINVLKVFDLVISLAPESTQANANVIALAMWRTAFGGVNDFGTGSAIAVFLFLLVDPGARAERPPLQEGDLTAVAAPALELPEPRGADRRREDPAPGRQGTGADRARRARPALARADDRPLHHLDPAPADARLEGLVADLLQAEPRHLVELRRACSTTTGWSAR